MSLFGVDLIDEFCPPRFWNNGPSPGSIFNFPGVSRYNNSAFKRTKQPTVTGASVLGLKFEGGVVIAADMLGCYGMMAKFRDCERIMKVNNDIMLGCSGDYADFQYLKQNIEQKVTEEECLDDGHTLKPRSLYTWLTRILYNRRSKFNPLWTNLIIGGMQDNKPFLASIDKLGMAFTDHHIATGHGAYIVLPRMRDTYEKNPKMSKAEAQNFLAVCMQTLYYRDARSFPRYQLATVTSEGVVVEGPFSVMANWDVALLVTEER